MHGLTSTQNRHALRFSGILTIAAIVWVLDVWTKRWVHNHFVLGESRPVFSWLSMTYVHNTGTAFGLFQGNNKALLILALVILGMLLYAARGLTEQGGFWGALGVALVLGGAVGNITDRLHYGQVIDFIDLHVWPVFNLADSSITVGTASLMIGLWRAKE